jgi:hypothetical protein
MCTPTELRFFWYCNHGTGTWVPVQLCIFKTTPWFLYATFRIIRLNVCLFLYDEMKCLQET